MNFPRICVTPLHMWTRFLKTQITDPNLHRPERFCYLVHGVAEDQTLMAVAEELGKSFDRIHLIRNPQNITGNPLISVSLINENRRETFASSGLILYVAPDHVIGAFHRDLKRARCPGGLTEEEMRTLKELFVERENFMSPEHLLEVHMLEGHHNEIVVAPVIPSSGTAVKVIGFFVKTRDGRALPSESRMFDLESKSAEFALPIVFIAES